MFDKWLSCHFASQTPSIWPNVPHLTPSWWKFWVFFIYITDSFLKWVKFTQNIIWQGFAEKMHGFKDSLCRLFLRCSSIYWNINPNVSREHYHFGNTPPASQLKFSIGRTIENMVRKGKKLNQCTMQCRHKLRKNQRKWSKLYYIKNLKVIF